MHPNEQALRIALDEFLFRFGRDVIAESTEEWRLEHTELMDAFQHAQETLERVR